MKLVDRIDAICFYYYFKSWRDLTDAQKRRSIELYTHWTKFANLKYQKERNYVEKITAQKT